MLPHWDSHHVMPEHKHFQWISTEHITLMQATWRSPPPPSVPAPLLVVVDIALPCVLLTLPHVTAFALCFPLLENVLCPVLPVAACSSSLQASVPYLPFPS